MENQFNTSTDSKEHSVEVKRETESFLVPQQKQPTTSSTDDSIENTPINIGEQKQEVKNSVKNNLKNDKVMTDNKQTNSQNAYEKDVKENNELVRGTNSNEDSIKDNELRNQLSHQLSQYLNQKEKDKNGKIIGPSIAERRGIKVTDDVIGKILSIAGCQEGDNAEKVFKRYLTIVNNNENTLNDITDKLVKDANLEDVLSMTNKDIIKQQRTKRLKSKGIEIISRLDHKKLALETPSYLVDGIIPFADRNGSKAVLIAGADGSGKSLLIQSIAYAISLNMPFAGHFKVNNPEKRGVLIFSGEDGLDSNYETIDKQELVLKTPENEDRVMDVYGVEDITDKETLEEIFETFKDTTGSYPILAVADSVTFFSGIVKGCDTWKSTDIVKLQYTFNRVASSHGCTPLWIAHTKKKVDESGDRKRNVAGSYGLTAGCLQVINLEKSKGENDIVDMYNSKCNRMSDKDRKVIHRFKINDNRLVEYLESRTEKTQGTYSQEDKRKIVSEIDEYLSMQMSWKNIAINLGFITDETPKEDYDNIIGNLSHNYRNWKKAFSKDNSSNSLTNNDKNTSQE